MIRCLILSVLLLLAGSCTRTDQLFYCEQDNGDKPGIRYYLTLTNGQMTNMHLQLYLDDEKAELITKSFTVDHDNPRRAHMVVIMPNNTIQSFSFVIESMTPTRIEGALIDDIPGRQRLPLSFGLRH